MDPDEPVIIGLPDTIWFPEDALCHLPDSILSFLLFPVEHPELFDAVILDGAGAVLEIQVKKTGARSRWVWGAFKMQGSVLRELFQLWRERGQSDEFRGRRQSEFSSYRRQRRFEHDAEADPVRLPRRRRRA